MLHLYYDRHEETPFFGAFRSQGYLSEATIPGFNAEQLAMANLPPLLRTLLITDGTVTKSLEAFFWEPVTVDTILLETVTAARQVNWLEVTPGEEVLLREVQLRGTQSQRIYATAFSVVRLSVLSPEIREALTSGKVGIGVLIRDSGLESYREILDIKADNREFLLTAVKPEAPQAADIVSRTYRIIANHQPAILITENFPITHYAR
ncbi:chorismate--pyruvate lyase family protein [Teredinibacter turnerae]|uniref:chorismate--pyruvate lyase family protein n=1 Tax=Teredinibacter turnerae TaxID=2426 RepID=UPI000365872C|nr:chorismate pyruvate-lyase family protein [Teredinibacter turnerae]